MKLGELSDKVCIECGRGIRQVSGFWMHIEPDATHMARHVNRSKPDLTYRDFVAHLIYTLDSPGPKVLWLASSDEHKATWLKRADTALENWKNRELTAEQFREEIRGKDSPK